MAMRDVHRVTAVAGLNADETRVAIGRGTEHTSMHTIGSAIAEYLSVVVPAQRPKTR